MKKSTKIIFTGTVFLSVIAFFILGSLVGPAIILFIIFPAAIFTYLLQKDTKFPHKKLALTVFIIAVLIYWASIAFANACKVDYIHDSNGNLQPTISCSVRNIFE